MIQGKQHKAFNLFFRLWVPRYLKLHFHEILIFGDIPVSEKSILLLGNHTSWWDGFLAFYLNMKLFHRRFWFMMLESELKQRKVLSKIGGFSVHPGNRSVVESLQYAKNLLADKNNLVLMYPQGILNSAFEDKIIFQKGIDRLLIGSNSTQVVFVAQFIEFFDKAKPTAFIYLKEHNITDSFESAYQQFFNDSLNQQKQLRK